MKRSGEAEINGKPDDIRHNGHRKKKTACLENEQAGVPIDRVIGGLRERKGLFNHLTLESVGFVSSENEDLTVTDDFGGLALRLHFFYWCSTVC